MGILHFKPQHSILCSKNSQSVLKDFTVAHSSILTKNLLLDLPYELLDTSKEIVYMNTTYSDNSPTRLLLNSKSRHPEAHFDFTATEKNSLLIQYMLMVSSFSVYGIGTSVTSIYTEILNILNIDSRTKHKKCIAYSS